MADDLKNHGPQDRARVNLSEAHEVQYWTQKWDVTAERLTEAVRAVGSSSKAVAAHLGKGAE